MAKQLKLEEGTTQGEVMVLFIATAAPLVICVLLLTAVVSVPMAKLATKTPGQKPSDNRFVTWWFALYVLLVTLLLWGHSPSNRWCTVIVPTS